MKRTLTTFFWTLLCAGATLAQAPAARTKMPDTPSNAGSSAACQPRPPLWLTVGPQRFAMTLEDNPTAHAFAQLLPATFDMPDLNGNEKHVRLPRSLPTNPARPGTIRAGDVMLYGNDTLVVFYETFSSSYSYTRIGRVADSAGLAKVLGPGNSRVGFSVP